MVFNVFSYLRFHHTMNTLLLVAHSIAHSVRWRYCYEYFAASLVLVVIVRGLLALGLVLECF